MHVPPHQHALERIRAEYAEMPGMCLTIEQVQRLCGLERHICEAVLAALVDTRFLCRTATGVYVRATDDLQVRPRAAKATLQKEIRAAHWQPKAS